MEQAGCCLAIQHVAGASGGALGAGGARSSTQGVRSTTSWAAWAQPRRTGWAKLVHYAPGSILTQFLTQF